SQHLLHLPQPPARLFPGRNRSNHHRSPLEPLGALLHRRSASPVVLRPNRPREWIRGELFILPGLFPLPLCAAGAGEQPPPPPPRLLSPVAQCQKIGTADSPPRRGGQSAGQVEVVQRRCCLWYFRRI